MITVGAVDIEGTVTAADDIAAPWSAYGYTYDGFAKPDPAAPGRYLVGPVPAVSAFASSASWRSAARGYMQLSGTSFAAPAVSGAAANPLARHPSWTPGQVKGALLATARIPQAAVRPAVGAGELSAGRASRLAAPPKREPGARAVSDPRSERRRRARLRRGDLGGDGGAEPPWDAATWTDATWTDATWTDRVESARGGPRAGYLLTPAEEAAILADPDLRPQAQD